ncbi:MAG: hypothetical protein IKL87_06710 [Oscillospiraceae bacterium]|nr:hypothetical protein [Oscillospiraceae bacterium]
MSKYDWIDTAICIFAAGALLLGGGMMIGSCSEHMTPIEADSGLSEPPAPQAAMIVTQPTQPPVTEKQLVAASTPDGPYLLRLEEETLAIYAVGTDTPFEQYAISPAWLPEYDRVLLQYGIEVESTAEMRRLVEDYLS